MYSKNVTRTDPIKSSQLSGFDSRKKDDDKKKKNESHLMDLLDISFGATSISNAPSTQLVGDDAWGASALGATGMTAAPTQQQPNPWSSRPTASPALADPWVPSLNKPATSASPALKMDAWNTRTHSLSITSNSSVENWEAGAGGLRTTTNGNASAIDAWSATTKPADPWSPNKPADPWSPPPTADFHKDFGVSE